jgi:hypothetical protein
MGAPQGGRRDLVRGLPRLTLAALAATLPSGDRVRSGSERDRREMRPA